MKKLTTLVISGLVPMTGFLAADSVNLSFAIGEFPNITEKAVGLLVADTDGDGFSWFDEDQPGQRLNDFLFTGATIGDDDVVLAVMKSKLVDRPAVFKSAGSSDQFFVFETSEPIIISYADRAAALLAAPATGSLTQGMNLGFYWAESDGAGPGDSLGFFRNNNADRGVGSTTGFVLPDFGVHSLIALTDTLGGEIPLADLDANITIPIPEPGTSILGLLGVFVFTLRRRSE